MLLRFNSFVITEVLGISYSCSEYYFKKAGYVLQTRHSNREENLFCNPFLEHKRSRKKKQNNSLPLHTVGEAGAVVGSRSIMTSHGVQKPVVGGHTDTASPLGHGGTQAPLVGVGVKTLHGFQAGAPVSPTNGVQPGMTTHKQANNFSLYPPTNGNFIWLTSFRPR